MTGVVEEGQRLSAQTHGEAGWGTAGAAVITDQKIMTVLQAACNGSQFLLL